MISTPTLFTLEKLLNLNINIVKKIRREKPIIKLNHPLSTVKANEFMENYNTSPLVRKEVIHKVSDNKQTVRVDDGPTSGIDQALGVHKAEVVDITHDPVVVPPLDQFGNTDVYGIDGAIHNIELMNQKVSEPEIGLPDPNLNSDAYGNQQAMQRFLEPPPSGNKPKTGDSPRGTGRTASCADSFPFGKNLSESTITSLRSHRESESSGNRWDGDRPGEYYQSVSPTPRNRPSEPLPFPQQSIFYLVKFAILIGTPVVLSATTGYLVYLFFRTLNRNNSNKD